MASAILFLEKNDIITSVDTNEGADIKLSLAGFLYRKALKCRQSKI